MTDSDTSLLSSAYDFVEHSLEEAEVARDNDSRHWKFAIIDIATAVELFVKERLRREHSLLIYTNVDSGTGHTVSLDVALKRLHACKVEIIDKDRVRLMRARDIRNSIVHFNTQASADQLHAAYADLFEFAHTFHARELGEELHENIGKSYWAIEAAFIKEFHQTFVQYQGDAVHKEWPSILIEAQYLIHWVIDGTAHRRIPYGDPREGWEENIPDRPCHDCSALPGQLHGEGCDSERCPNCGGQTLVGCCGESREMASGPGD